METAQIVRELLTEYLENGQRCAEIEWQIKGLSTEDKKYAQLNEELMKLRDKLHRYATSSNIEDILYSEENFAALVLFTEVSIACLKKKMYSPACEARVNEKLMVRDLASSVLAGIFNPYISDEAVKYIFKAE